MYFPSSKLGKGPNNFRKIIDGVSSNDDDDNDNSDDQNNEKSEDELEDSAKELATRTILAVRWLHSRNRLTFEEKSILSNDIIENVGNGEFSKAEIAFSLLVGGGKPSDNQANDIPLDMNLVDDDDMKEFEDMCRLIVKSYKESLN